ncbi:MAG: hypothetical protein F6J87_31095 [Spirulina sp. SIO3F2]|nr:hypothetical protein [Spirulina sp. SIO3F2]
MTTETDRQKRIDAIAQQQAYPKHPGSFVDNMYAEAPDGMTYYQAVVKDLAAAFIISNGRPLSKPDCRDILESADRLIEAIACKTLGES